MIKINNLSLSFIFILFFFNVNCQTVINNTNELISNNDCYSAYKLCDAISGYYDLRNDEQDGKCQILPLYFSFRTTISPVNGLRVIGDDFNVILYGPFQSDNISNCEAINSGQVSSIETLFSTVVNGTFTFDNLTIGFYIIELVPLSCSSEFSINPTYSRTFNCEQELDCQNCITSFSPEPGKYVVSGWVKELGVSQTVLTYSNSKIEVSYDGNISVQELGPSGKIIDGWQRIEGIVDVPIDATDIHLTLQAANNNAVFDDIRFYPNDGSMMSYVYDPITLKLVAELDERNYATFYEYDEEGKLIRIKKETEKGIMTIQENRDNIVKKP